MRILAALLVIGLLLPASAMAGRSSFGGGARKSKVSRRDSAPMMVEGTKRSKRRDDDPVLRRYGKRPQDVAYVEYKGSKKAKTKRQADDEILVIDDAPAKRTKPAKQLTKRDADEEILIIEDAPKAKRKQARKPAKSKRAAADDEILIIED